MWTTRYDLRPSGELAGGPGAAEPRRAALVPATHVARSAPVVVARAWAAGRALRLFGRVWLEAQARAAGLLREER